MFAVIKTGGKQYIVKEGDILQVEKLEANNGQKINFDQVLLIEDREETLIGTPFIENALVRAEVVKNLKGEKVLIFKKKRRKQYRRTRGHRQELTEVRVEEIIRDRTSIPVKRERAVEVRVEGRALPEKKPEKEMKPKKIPEERAEVSRREKVVKKPKVEERPKVKRVVKGIQAKKAKPKPKKRAK